MKNQRNFFNQLMKRLEKSNNQNEIEKDLKKTIRSMPDKVTINSNQYYPNLNYNFYNNILKCYKHDKDKICLWRFYKNISNDQLDCKFKPNSDLEMIDFLVRTYYYSDP